MNIAIGGQRVDEVDTEHAVTLRFSGGAAVRIEGSFEFHGSGSKMLTLDPENLGTDHGLRDALEGQTINSAIADSDSGTLVITFDVGISLHVLPDPEFEAWSATLSDGTKIVALPGGGLSRWGAQS
jgi:hypothetical protein